MPHIPFHPAVGFGDLMTGWMVVPQNPIRDAGTPMVPSLQALAAGRPVRKPHLAELMPGQFAVPQNPLRDALGMGRLGIWNSGQGVGFPGYPDYGMAIPNKPQGVGFPGLPSYGLGCSDCGYGMGDISTWFTDSTLSDSVSFPNWMVLAGVGVGLMIFGGKKRR